MSEERLVDLVDACLDLIKERCQCGRIEIYPRWASLADFNFTTLDHLHEVDRGATSVPTEQTVSRMEPD